MTDLKLLMIENDGGLSVRSKNALRRAGVYTVFDMMKYDAQMLSEVPQLGAKSIAEILNRIEYYKTSDISAPVCAEASGRQTESASEPSVFDRRGGEKKRNAVMTYVRINDVSVSEMSVSTRSKNKLLGAGYERMSDIVFLTGADVEAIGGIGANSVREIANEIACYRREHEENIKRYIGGDISVLIDDSRLLRLIEREFRAIGFAGLSVSELSERIAKTAEVSEERIKKSLGILVARGVLEYVDYRCYLTYMKFSDYYRTADMDERDRAILCGRLGGKTLEEIGIELSITRERVRQLLKRGAEKAKKQYTLQTGLTLFDEDYYAYLYETYDFNHAEAGPWLGVADEVWNYLDIAGLKKGKLPLESALKDTQNLEAGLRLKIKNYINRNRVYIDGKWIEKTRLALEPVVVKKYCKQDVTFTAFVDIFNQFLMSEEIPYDEDVYYTESVLATRKNRFQESRNLLWKFGERFRYYDIDGQDYTELLEVLDLGSYHNVELSTAKFASQHPGLMEKYDIRDEYELHNLLKKVLESDTYGRYGELEFSKMPIIRFGTPDRDGALFGIMVENAPIGRDELISLIHREYGYDERQIPFYLAAFSEYYHRGVYTIDQKEMSRERRDDFLRILEKDFYTFDELKRIYVRAFANADPEEVNAYNLKRMGFLVNSGYALKNYPSVGQYLETVLTEKDNFDITPIKNVFNASGASQTYQQVWLELRKKAEIIEYAPDRYIHFRKLASEGMTKAMIREFCDAVYEAAPTDAFFSIAYLKRGGFDSELFDWGFDDLFYGNLLLSDERFSCKKMFGAVIVCKNGDEISVKNLVSQIVEREKRIDLYDLESVLRDEYGCMHVNIYDLPYKTKEADLFYDAELQVFYEDQELYYREIDGTEDFD